MQIGQAQFVHDRAGPFEHGFRFGRETGDQVGAEHHVRASLARAHDKSRRIGPGVTPLHALQYHVVGGLQAQMQVRHQARFLA